MPSASDPRQQNRTRKPVPRPAQPGQRPAQPTQRAAQPAARTVQSFSHSAKPVQRTGQQPSARSVQHAAFHAAQQPTARTAQPAGGTRFKQQAPTQRTQAPQSHSHHGLAVRMALLRRPARATTRILVAVLKRRVLRFP